MKKNLFTSGMVACAFLLLSCEKNNEQVGPEETKFITVDAGVGSLTRATETSFEKGDKISVYAWTGNTTDVGTLVVDNALNTFDGSKWTAEPQMLWKDMITPHFFISVYPAKAVTDFKADSYQTAPDLLVATVLEQGRVASGGIVPLTFNHVMARLDVNLKFRNQFDGTPTVEKGYVNALSASTVNYLTQTVTAVGDVGTLNLTDTTPNTAYTIILPPQSIHTVAIVIDGKTYTYTNTEGFSLEKGKIQTLNLIVGRDQIELGSVVVNDWGTGEVIEGGEAQEN
ncbi:MAG: fimbrillin family protein [Bacteroidales bacterium]